MINIKKVMRMKQKIKRILAKVLAVTLIGSMSFTPLMVNASEINTSILNGGNAFKQSATNGIVSEDIKGEF